MKLPRDVSADALIKGLRTLGYVVTRQTGSHIRVTTQAGGQHHEVIPYHNPIRIGTLHSILKSVGQHHKMSVEELVQRLEL
jgi:predicted RNA binding protein YcfA (HicA-like mRNA interferase family)